MEKCYGIHYLGDYGLFARLRFQKSLEGKDIFTISVRLFTHLVGYPEIVAPQEMGFFGEGRKFARKCLSSYRSSASISNNSISSLNLSRAQIGLDPGDRAL